MVSALSSSLSLYLHIPFCQTRCSYCAFNTYTRMSAWVEPYVAALQREMQLVSHSIEADQPGAHTLYFGGGTPSLLTPAHVSDLISAARRYFALLPTAEITLEVNPGTVSLTVLEEYRSAGVNRISIGVQSAHARDLTLFNRSHTFQQAAEAFYLTRRAGFDNVNVDLIYGIPGQTCSEWNQTLEAVIGWQPDHVSVYSLTLEPGTALAFQVERGTLPPPDPDLAADMYEDAQAVLAAAGLAQYEISNWARPGSECIHNQQYWRNRPFLGFGAGAHGAAGGKRYWNVRPIRRYIERVASGDPFDYPLSPAVEDRETIDEALSMAETVILGLRMVREGIAPSDFMDRFGVPLDEAFREIIAPLQTGGLLERVGDTLRLARRAYLISNQVFLRFLPERP